MNHRYADPFGAMTALTTALFLSLTGCYHVVAVEEDGWNQDDGDRNSDTDIGTDHQTPVKRDSDSPIDPDSDSPVPFDTSPPVTPNYCLAFNGTSGYVRVPHDDVLHPKDQWTVEAWIYFEQDGEDWLPVLRKGDASIAVSGYFLYGRYRGPQPTGGYRTSSTTYVRLTPEDPLTPGLWTHLAVTYDAGTSRFFVNGISAAEDRSNLPFESVSSDLIFGALLPTSSLAYMNGCIDEIRISDVVRYETDFTPLERFEPDPDTVALWHFDEGGGVIVLDEIHGLRGTLYGNVTFAER